MMPSSIPVYIYVRDPTPAEKENYDRCHKLLADVGRRVFRRFLIHVLQKTGIRDLSSFLSTHQMTLNSYRKRRIISKHELVKLFPNGQPASETSDWDLTLLGHVLTICCNLTAAESSAVDEIRSYRNSIIGHSTSLTLTDAYFKTTWDTIVSAIKVLVTSINDETFKEDVDAKVESIRTPPTTRVTVSVPVVPQTIVRSADLASAQAFLQQRYQVITEMKVLKIVSQSVNVSGVYVDSNVINVKNRYGFDPDAEEQVERVTSYNQFFDGANPKNVYLIGSSGRGKTTFSLKLVNAWCQGLRHRQDRTELDENERYLSETFDLILFVFLGNALKDDSVASMIKSQLFNENHSCFDHVLQLLKQQPRRVLVILDGYDEWQGSDTDMLPNREHLNNCVTLMTLRLSKVSKLPIRSTDQVYEIRELDEVSVRNLVENVAMHVCGDANASRVDACIEAMKQRHLTLVTEIPLVLTYLVCLWYETKSFGNSRTNIYFRLIQFLLYKTFGTEKEGNAEKTMTRLPKVFEKCPMCRQYEDFILDLGRFAFDSLLNEDGRLTYTQHSLVGLLGSTCIERGLSTGLLVVSPIPSVHSPGTVDVQFFHKTVQDFLAAVYIASDPEGTNPLNKLLTFVNTFERVVDASEVLISVCGMLPGEGEKISTHIASVTSKSTQVMAFRQSLDERYVYSPRQQMSTYKYVKLIQKLQLRCFRETQVNRELAPNQGSTINAQYGVVFSNPTRRNFSLNDVLVVDTVRDVIIDVASKQQNQNVKSVYVDVPAREDTSAVQSLVMKCSNIERLHLDRSSSGVIYDLEVVQLRSLTSLTLVLNDVSHLPDAFAGLASLTHLCLDVTGSHGMVQELVSFLQKKATLEELSLEKVLCRDHVKSDDECEFNLPLHKLTNLSKLHLNDVKSESTTLPISLRQLEMTGFTRNATSVLQCLDAPTLMLTELMVGHHGLFYGWKTEDYEALSRALSMLNCLRILSIIGVKYNGLILTSHLRELREVFLHDVTFYEDGWVKFLESLAQTTSNADVEIVRSHVYVQHQSQQRLTSNEKLRDTIEQLFSEVCQATDSTKFKLKK